jgi:hypothetical protein
MVIVMDMRTGQIEKMNEESACAEAEFGEFVDEVLNAGWLPQPTERLEMHAHAAPKTLPEVDADEFLRNLYRAQE